jgi:hypothetical protein
MLRRMTRRFHSEDRLAEGELISGLEFFWLEAVACTSL